MNQNQLRKQNFLNRFLEGKTDKAEFLLLVMALSGAIKLETVDEDEGAPVMANTSKLLAILGVIDSAIGTQKAELEMEQMGVDEIEAIAAGKKSNPFNLA